MAVFCDPVDYENARLVMAKCDADSNQEAIREITAWAREHGFVRTNEYHLATLRTSDNKLYYQSPVYRLDDDIRRDTDETIARNRARHPMMPEAPASAGHVEAS